MADQLPSAIDPITGDDKTVLGFLQALRTDLDEIKTAVGATPPPPPVTKTGSQPSGSNSAPNPVLAQDATGWSNSNPNYTAGRVPVADHVYAGYAYEVPVGADGAFFLYAPQRALATYGSGYTLTLAVDVQIESAASSISVETSWGGDAYPVSGVSTTTSVPTDGAWHRVEIDVSTSQPGGHIGIQFVATGVQEGDVVRATLADYVGQPV
ncbi:MAG: hypothetical protein JWO98_4109 [Frankiales bacterium]|nr:hypothetical protein [Frankiales bacterium]